MGAPADGGQAYQMFIGKAADGRRLATRCDEERIELGSNFANVREFARAEDSRMAGGDLLDQTGTRARHADNEDGKFGRAAPVGNRTKKHLGEGGNLLVD